jgi:peptide/nickel transport system substrate-binding protein
MFRYTLRAPLASFFIATALMATASIAADDSSITISQAVDASTLNPVLQPSTPTLSVLDNVYERLWDFSSKPGEHRPMLAASWRRIGSSITEFKLRPGAQWCDGTPVTSADVAFTYAWIRDPANKSAQTTYLRGIDRVETPDPKTVRLISDRPSAFGPGLFTPFHIISAAFTRAHGSAYLGEHACGSGPYLVREWRRDDTLTLEANPRYNGSRPSIARVIFRPIPDPAARVAALRTGQTDVISAVPAQYATILEGSTSTRMSSLQGVTTMQAVFDTGPASPLADTRVRRALAAAVDRNAIVRGVLRGRGYPMRQFIPENFVGFNPSLTDVRYDPSAARALLSAAGFTAEKPLTFTLHTPSGRYPHDADVASALAEQWKAVGVRVSVETHEPVTFINLAQHKSLHSAFLIAWTNWAADGQAGFLGSQYISDAPFSVNADPQLDRLYEIALTDATKHVDALRRAAQRVAETVPGVPLFEYEDLYASTRRLRWMPRVDQFFTAADMSLSSVPTAR